MAIIPTLKGIFAAFAGALPLSVVATRRASTTATRAAARPAPVRMTSAQQWDKVTSVLNSAIGAAEHARDLQASAAQQLDLATYALYNLFDELSSVMSEPLVREAAVVHRLPNKARRAPARALAA